MFEVENGISLCYACHIRKVHREDSSYALLSRICNYILKVSISQVETAERISHMIKNYGVNSVEAVTEPALIASKKRLIKLLGGQPGLVCKQCAWSHGAKTRKVPVAVRKGTCNCCGTETQLFKADTLDWGTQTPDPILSE